jgi:hypothetical protein
MKSKTGPSKYFSLRPAIAFLPLMSNFFLPGKLMKFLPAACHHFFPAERIILEMKKLEQ